MIARETSDGGGERAARGKMTLAGTKISVILFGGIKDRGGSLLSGD